MINRKLTAAFLFVLALILIPLRAVQAEKARFSDRDGMLAYLTENRPSDLEFTCSGDLYSELREGEFTGLYRMLVYAGIDHSRAEISYNDFMRLISLRSLEYTDRPWAECRYAEDVRQAFEKLSDDGSDFVLICTDELLRLLMDEHYLSVIAAQNGIRDYYSLYSNETGILVVKDINFFDKPYAVVNDYARFASVISVLSAKDIHDFYVVFDPDLFNRIMGDQSEMTVMTGSSRLTGYGGTIYYDSCTIYYSGAEFTDAPRELCRTVDEVPDAIRRMGAVGIRDFELIFPYTEVFDTLCANDFALFREIEARAGMLAGEISYSSGHDRILFRNAEIVPNAVALTTAADAIAETARQIEAGAADIHLFCTADLYRYLLGDLTDFSVSRYGLNRIYDLITHAGIFDYNISVSESTHVINIHINRFFPGTAIIRAEKSGDSSGLTPREQKVRQAAMEIAAAARQSDPLQTAKYIHDWLCAHVAYADDELTDEDDTAIGAILSGRANCDGYTDAFYLIGTLAGLNIRYQHGDSLDKNYWDAWTSPVSHIWNLLEIGGVWHMVDVTWDDEENGWTYVWFNVGRNIADRMHVWNEDMTVSIAPDTVRMADAGSDFYISSEQDLRDAVDQAARRGLSDFYILFENPGLAYLAENARQMVMERSENTVLNYFWKDRILLLGILNVYWR